MAQEKPAAGSDARAGPPFLLGPVEVRPASNELVVDGAVRRLKPRLMDVLLRLAAAPGEVVTREAMLTDAWPRRMVNDEVLSRAIADLRVALGDDAREARFIETLPKVGYRLIAPVQPLARTAAPAPAPSALATTRIPRWRIALAAIAAILLTALLAQRWLRPPPAPAGADLTRQLAGAVPFASDEGLELAPRFAPDGSRVAYALGDASSARIVIRDVAGTRSITLGDPASVNLAPVFFPDGKRLAYFRRNAAGDCAIVAHDLTTHAEATLADCTRRPQPRFDLSPDGSHLVYTGVVRDQFPAGLVLREIASGRERVLTAPAPGAGDDRYPRFAPDGKRVVFFRGTESHREAWLIATTSDATATSLDSPRGLSYGAAWLGNDGPLLVAADWFGQRSLNRLDLATREAVGVGARGARFPDVAVNGDIVFENAVYRADLHEIAMDEPTRTPLVRWPSTRYTNQPEYAPDGRSVLFVSNRDGTGALYVATADEAPRRVLPADDYTYLRPHWSLDGRAIYAVRATLRPDGAREQHAVRIAWPEGRVEVLERLGSGVTDVRELDATHLLVGEAAGNAARLLRSARDGSASERLPLPLASELAVAGGRIAFTQPELAGLTLCDAQARACETLPLPIDERNRFDWLLTSDAVWYAAQGEPRTLVRYDLARREIVARHPFAPTALGLSFAVAPDGRSVLVAREAPVAIDLLLARRP